MFAAQVVSVFPDCGQEQFADKNLAVNSLKIRPHVSEGIPRDILRVIRDGIIRRQCCVVTLNKSVHANLFRMGFNALLVYPKQSHENAPAEWKKMAAEVANYDGVKIALPVGYQLADAIIYDHETRQFQLTEKALSWIE